MKQLCLLFFIFFSHCGHSLDLNQSIPADEAPATSTDEILSENRILTIISINVGQGDATLLITPSWKTILIDGGYVEKGTNNILPLFSQLGVTKLDYIFTSHYDADHIGGISEVIAGPDKELDTDDDLKPEITYDSGDSPVNSDGIFQGYLGAIGSSRQTLLPGDIINFGDGVSIECLIINGNTSDGEKIHLEEDDENGRSMGLLITYGDFRHFTAGDLPGGGLSGNSPTVNLEDMVASLVGKVDIVHVNHHGSETSSSRNYLEELSPTVALISTGNGNPHGHPESIILNRLSDVGAEVYQTEAGSGGLLPDAHILNDSIFIFVNEDGGYEVNGDGYLKN